MLTDAVLEGGGVGRFLKPRAACQTIARSARHPRRTDARCRVAMRAGHGTPGVGLRGIYGLTPVFPSPAPPGWEPAALRLSP